MSSTPAGIEVPAAREGTVASDYGADYYSHYAVAGISYERSPFWIDFFGKIADRLIEDFPPEDGAGRGLRDRAARRGAARPWRRGRGDRLQRFRGRAARPRGRPALPDRRFDHRAAREALRPDHVLRGRRAHAAPRGGSRHRESLRLHGRGDPHVDADALPRSHAHQHPSAGVLDRAVRAPWVHPRR